MKKLLIILITLLLLSSITNLKPIGAEDYSSPEEIVLTDNENDTAFSENEDSSQEEENVFFSGELISETNDYKITLIYDESAQIPEDSHLEVSEISEDDSDYNDYYINAASSINEDSNSLPYARFFDIGILDKNNNIIEPQSSVKVQIDLKDNATETEDVTFAAVHFTDNNVDVIDVDTKESISFEADSFSVYGVVYYYTVDFYFGDYEYHMNGGSEMMLSELFDKLHIDRKTNEIENIEFSDYSLIALTDENKDYRITSLKPFITNETLTIYFNDKEIITISVQDAIVVNRTRENAWVMLFDDATETLTLRLRDNQTALNGIQADRYSKTDWDNDWKTGPNGTDFRSRVKKVQFIENKGGKFTFNGCSVAGMFAGFNNLEEVDFSGLDSSTSPYSIASMFEDCTSLTTIKNLENLNVSNTNDFSNMFKNCSSLENLDVSSFGKLNSVDNMDGFVANCKNLKTLNISNLDNSNIIAKNSNHTPNNGRMIFGVNNSGKGVSIDSSLPNLKTIVAVNSKVWMSENTKGNPGSEYFLAENNNAVYYFTEKQIKFDSENGQSITIETKRDYIDLITDRHETGGRGLDNHEESSTNKNMTGGSSLNTNGAGFLAPGTYTILNDDRVDPVIEVPITYYRITEMGKPSTTYTVVLNESLNGVLTMPDSYTVTTDELSRSSFWEIDGTDKVLEKKDSSGNLETLITITYKGAATDINNEKHDVVVKVKRITFKDVDLIPNTDDYNRRTHDGNYVAGDEYSRTVLEAQNDKISLNNYAYSNSAQGIDGTHASGVRVLTNGSGTYIDFDIEIADAINGSSVLFYIDDLDVPHAQKWVNDDNDACFDKLTWEKVIYGDGSEGMILGMGNDIDTLSFADHTGLQLLNRNYVVATGSDPSTSWSEFYVRANAKKSSYTWTSGIACDTYILKNTEPVPAPKPVWIMPEAIKHVNSVIPGGVYADKYFEFTFSPASDTGSDYSYNGIARSVTSLTNKAIVSQSINNTNEHVTITELEFRVPTSNEPEKYIYEIKEEEGSAGDIISYDTDTKHYMQVLVFRPTNDLEMYQGTRAEIILGTKKGDGSIVWNTDDVYVVYSTNAQLVDDKLGPDNQKVFVDAQGIEFYRIDDKYFNYDDQTEMTPTSHAKVDRKIEYNSKDYTVKVDKNGVEYFADDDGKYRDPNDPVKELIKARIGDIDPDTVKNDSPVAKEKKIGNQTVYEDVHGIEYYGSYFDLNGNELEIKDGTFNPNINDKVVYVNATSSTGETIYKHANGQEYFVKDNKYYDANNESKELIVKTEGDVDPLPNDKNAQVNEIQTKPLRETFSGDGNIVYLEQAHGIEYYVGRDGHYYTRFGTMLELGNDFSPTDSDNRVQISREIWVDGSGLRFYKNEGQYYSEFDDTLIGKLSDGTLDTSEVIEMGTFNNRTNVSDITIIKNTTKDKAGDKAGKFKVHVQFDNGFEPKYVVYEPASTSSFKKVEDADNTWEFVLEDGQRMTIKEVPFNTTYTISEPTDKNGWELVDIVDKDGDPSKSKTITTKSDTGDYNEDYKHTITNRFTEVLVNKKVTQGSKTREFSFTANIKVSDSMVKFTYGYLNETKQEFFISENNEASLEFTLKDGEDIALVVPLNSTVNITESAPEIYTVTNTKNNSNSTGDFTVSTDKEVITFENSCETATLVVNWDDNNNYRNTRPDDLVGYITYLNSSGEEITVKTTDDSSNKWNKLSNSTWEYAFEVPSGIQVIDWGQDDVPANYKHNKTEDKSGDNRFTITNHLDIYNPEPDKKYSVPKTGI